MKILENIENKTYDGLKDLLIGVYNSICESKTSITIEDLQKIHKQAIVLKAFDLVSIILSFMGYMQYKKEPARYYKALCNINDAKYLATSSQSALALKINLYMLAQIEFLAQNYDSAMDLVKGSAQIYVDEIYDFDQKILELKNKIELAKEHLAIAKSVPKFTPSQKAEDPLLALLKVGRTIALETNIDTLLTIIAQEIKLALNADRCTVFLLDKKKNELWSKVALGMDTQEIRFSAKLGLAGYVAQTGETINIKEAYKDPRFNKEIDSKTGYKTRTILCMPIRNMSHEIMGVFQVLNKVDGTFTQKDEDLLLAIGSSAGIALENANLFDKQEKLIQEQKDLLSSFIDTLSASIDARDKITSGHSKRVTLYVDVICETLNLKDSEKDLIHQASLLHDIGKIGIKDSVLQKEGKLTDEEYKHIQEHARITNDILGKIYLSKDFREVAHIASSHHEKYDGSGYFRNLKGVEIPLGGRILAVGDVFDAITSKRHYRSKMQIQEAIDVLIKGCDKHFDKDIVDAFLSIKTNKIVEIFLADTDIKLPSADKEILQQYKMIDLYNILTYEKENLGIGEQSLVEIFSKYY